MTKERRTAVLAECDKIWEALEALEAIKAEEIAYRDSLPVNMRQSKRYNEPIDTLDTGLGYLLDAHSSFNSLVEV